MNEDVINKIINSVDLVIHCKDGHFYRYSGENAVYFLERFGKESFIEYLEEAVSKHNKLIDNSGRIQFNVTPQDYNDPIFPHQFPKSRRMLTVTIPRYTIK